MAPFQSIITTCPKLRQNTPTPNAKENSPFANFPLPSIQHGILVAKGGQHNGGTSKHKKYISHRQHQDTASVRFGESSDFFLGFEMPPLSEPPIVRMLILASFCLCFEVRPLSWPPGNEIHISYEWRFYRPSRVG